MSDKDFERLFVFTKKYAKERIQEIRYHNLPVVQEVRETRDLLVKVNKRTFKRMSEGEQAIVKMNFIQSVKRMAKSASNRIQKLRNLVILTGSSIVSELLNELQRRDEDLYNSLGSQERYVVTYDTVIEMWKDGHNLPKTDKQFEEFYQRLVDNIYERQEVSYKTWLKQEPPKATNIDIFVDDDEWI